MVPKEEEEMVPLPLVVMDAIPAEVWAEVAMHFLDVRDLQRLDVLRPDLLLAAMPKGSAVFRSARCLTVDEKSWFAARDIRVVLLPPAAPVVFEQFAYLHRNRLVHLSLAGVRWFFPVRVWLVNGRPHRDDDLPAVEHANGQLEWFQHGRRHRDGDRPAVESPHGGREWWIEGKKHRDGDLPAAICVDDFGGGPEEFCRIWYQHGQKHRDNDRPAFEASDGSRAWFFRGKHHRDRGLPAVEGANGDRHWFFHGELHREGDMPAVEHADGDREWRWRGKLHRAGGRPAVIMSAHNSIHMGWWENGVQLKIRRRRTGPL